MPKVEKYLEYKQTKQKDPLAINSLKKRKRDLERLLAKTNSSTKLEQELTKINHLIAQNKELKKEQELELKYKYVKFVELKKSMRRKDGNQDYIQYFPVNQKYISIYKNESDNEMRDLIMKRIQEFKEKGLLRPGFKWRMSKDGQEQPPIEENVEQEQEQADDFFL